MPKFQHKQTPFTIQQILLKDKATEVTVLPERTRQTYNNNQKKKLFKTQKLILFNSLKEIMLLSMPFLSQHQFLHFKVERETASNERSGLGSQNTLLNAREPQSDGEYHIIHVVFNLIANQACYLVGHKTFERTRRIKKSS